MGTKVSLITVVLQVAHNSWFDIFAANGTTDSRATEFNFATEFQHLLQGALVDLNSLVSVQGAANVPVL